MAVSSTLSVVSSDHWISHPRGQLFARVWTPSQAVFEDNVAPVVLFHDSLGSIELWRDLPATLCALTGRKVVAYDRLGFGKSDARQDVLALDFIAEEAREFFPIVRESLKISHFVAFGHSVGGGMAVNCAAQHAADCEALVTIAAQAFPEERTLAGIRDAHVQFREEKQLERLRKYHGDKAEWVLNAWIRTWLHPDFAGWSLAPMLPEVKCPALIIHGEQDEYGSVVHPAMIGEGCGGKSTVEIIRGAGHMSHREQPEVVLPLIVDFLAAR